MSRRRRQQVAVGGAFGSDETPRFEAADDDEVVAFCGGLAPGETLRDRLLRLEVEAEFRRLQGALDWDVLANAVFQQMQRTRVAWAAHARWHRGTQLGKHQRRQRDKTKQSAVVAVVACKVCGELFERTAYDVTRGTGRVCSNACRSASRKNIVKYDFRGRALPISRWAEIYGLERQTVESRLAAGWRLVDALTKPLNSTRRKLSAADEARIAAATSGVRELCRELGVSYRTGKRIRKRAGVAPIPGVRLGSVAD